MALTLMNPSTGKAGGKPPEDWRQRRFSPWILSFAVLLHALLLLIPLAQQLPGSDTTDFLEITLIDEPPPPPEPLPEPTEPLEEEFTREVVTPPPEPAQVIIGAEPPPPESSEPTEPSPAPSQAVTVARLLESATELEWKEAPSAEREIARTTESELYDRLMKPVLEMKVHWFDDVIVPDKVEVMDRWLEASGVHRVVVRTPNGMTLCGRQEAPNDLRPWEQMPMMFGKCAGGWRKARPSKTWRDSPYR